MLNQAVYIVAYLLRVRTVKPQKQPLLANGSEITAVKQTRQTAAARQPLARQWTG
jgi:hypothetical protein